MRTWTGWAVGMAVVFGSAIGPLANAQDPAESAKKAGLIAYDTVTLGVELYNAGNHEGCFRLYQGTLMGLQPLLGPAAAETVRSALATAREQRPSEAAFTLRKALDVVMGGAKKPLWDRLGGEAAVKAVIHDFVGAAAGDPKVDFFRNGQFKLDAAGVELLERRLVELVSAVGGGPLKYSGKDMKTVHRGMKITDAEFDALAGHLVATLKKYKVPQAELDELVGLVAATRKDVVEVGKKPLWDRLGGEAAVRAVVIEFLTTAAKDPKVNLDRNGNYPLTKERVEKVVQQVVELVSTVTGGPLKYTGRDMKATHKGMKITSAEFDAAAGYLVAALKKFNVPQAEIDELVAIVATTKKDMVEER